MNQTTDPPRIPLWCQAIELSEHVCTRRSWPPLSLQHTAAPGAVLAHGERARIAVVDRLKGTGLGVRSLKRAAPKLHELTQGLYGHVAAAAVGRTHRLIMLTEYARQHPRRAIIPGTVTAGTRDLACAMTGTAALVDLVAAGDHETLVAGEQ